MQGPDEPLNANLVDRLRHIVDVWEELTAFQAAGCDGDQCFYLQNEMNYFFGYFDPEKFFYR